MPVIDVHTHVYSHEWFALLKEHGAPQYEVKKSRDYPAPLGIYCDGAPFATPMPGHFDYDLRVKAMNEAGVDISIVTLTAPSCFWGTPEISLKAAQLVNDSSADAQTQYPDRIRWMASIPWEHPELALPELERACNNGAIGVMVLANVNGRSLTEDAFKQIWQAIDDRGLPVLIHPTAPPGTTELDLRRFNLIAQIGFMFDTSLAVARMIYDGFLDRYPSTKFIVSHAGAALPYLAGRMDKCYEAMEAVRENIDSPPSDYLRRLYYDAVTYRQSSLQMCVDVGGGDKVMYGSDYPHNIGDMAGCLSRVNALSVDHRESVRGKNAERVFNL